MMPMVQKITVIDISPIALPNIKSNQKAIVKSSFKKLCLLPIPIPNLILF